MPGKYGEVLKDLNLLAEKIAEVANDCNDCAEEWETNFDQTIVKTYESLGLGSYISDILEAKETSIFPENPELFKEIQEKAFNYYTEMNEQAIMTAIVSYVENEGRFENHDPKCTLGALYLLDESDAEFNQEAVLSTKQRDALPGGAFCGPDRSFPAHDRTHALVGLRLLGRYKGGDKEKIRACLERKAKKFGVGKKDDESNLLFYPIIIEAEEFVEAYCHVDSKESAETTLANLEVIKRDCKLTDEQATDLSKNIKACIAYFEAPETASYEDITPLVLGIEFLMNYYSSTEDVKRNYLAPLVGLVRLKKVDKQTYVNTEKAYSVFATSILEHWLSSIPEVVETSHEEPPAVVETTTLPSTEVSEDAEEGKASKPKESNHSEANVYKKLGKRSRGK